MVSIGNEIDFLIEELELDQEYNLPTLTTNLFDKLNKTVLNPL